MNRHNQEDDYDHQIKEFKKRLGIHKIIAFSGGSNAELDGIPKDDPLQAGYQKIRNEHEGRFLDECIGNLRDYQVAILTGGTKWGFTKVATEKAKEYNLKTIGVYPLVGKKHALDDSLLDLSLCVDPQYGDSQWGDESPIYAKLLDAVIVFGCGAGTLIECAHILKINERLIGKQDLKYIVPITSSGGVASGLHFIWAKQEIRSACMPERRIDSGVDAAKFLKEKLNLYDYLIEK